MIRPFRITVRVTRKIQNVSANRTPPADFIHTVIGICGFHSHSLHNSRFTPASFFQQHLVVMGQPAEKLGIAALVRVMFECQAPIALRQTSFFQFLQLVP